MGLVRHSYLRLLFVLCDRVCKCLFYFWQCRQSITTKILHAVFLSQGSQNMIAIIDFEWRAPRCRRVISSVGVRRQTEDGSKLTQEELTVFSFDRAHYIGLLPLCHLAQEACLHAGYNDALHTTTVNSPQVNNYKHQ